MLQIGRPLVRSQLVSVDFFIDIKSFRSHYGHGIDPVSDRNDYQGRFLGGKGGRCVRLTTYHHPVPLPRNLANLNFLEPFGPVQACNGTALPLHVSGNYVSIIRWLSGLLLQTSHPYRVKNTSVA